MYHSMLVPSLYFKRNYHLIIMIVEIIRMIFDTAEILTTTRLLFDERKMQQFNEDLAGS